MSPPPLPQGLAPGGRFHHWAPRPPGLVVADIDGTLLGPSGEASPGVLDAIRAIRRAGLPFGVATGRMRLAAEEVARRLRAPGPHILENGAAVRLDGQTLASWPLTPSQVRSVIAICRGLGVYAELYVDTGFYVTAWREEARAHWEMLGHEPRGSAADLDPETMEVPKATFALFGEEPVAPLLEALEDAGLTAAPAGSPLTPEIRYVNATHPDAGKGRALLAAARHLGVDPGATVAVGDAPNDLPMFEVAGTAVAMGQADAEVRDAAHLVAPGLDGDGAAVALRACLTWATAGTAN